MQRKLTISISEDVYDGLYAKVGPRKIGKFLEGLARPHVVARPDPDEATLAAEYAEIAADEEREREALEWVEAQAGDTLPPDPGWDAEWSKVQAARRADDAPDADAAR